MFTKTPMTPAEGAAIIEAIRALSALSQKSVLTQPDEAAKRGFINFLNNNLLRFSPELLGCWTACRTEYEPLCNSIAALFFRAGKVLDARAVVNKSEGANEKTPEAPAPTPPATDNVVKFTKTYADAQPKS